MSKHPFSHTFHTKTWQLICKKREHMPQIFCSFCFASNRKLMRLRHLSHRRPAKAQAIRAVSQEPSLFAHISYGSRRRVRQKIRHLVPLDDCACVFEEWTYGGQKVPKSHELALMFILPESIMSTALELLCFGKSSCSKPEFITLDMYILIYVSLWIHCLIEIRKIAVCFYWFSMPGDYRVTDEALLAETT